MFSCRSDFHICVFIFQTNRFRPSHLGTMCSPLVERSGSPPARGRGCVEASEQQHCVGMLGKSCRARRCQGMWGECQRGHKRRWEPGKQSKGGLTISPGDGYKGPQAAIGGGRPNSRTVAAGSSDVPLRSAISPRLFRRRARRAFSAPTPDAVERRTTASGKVCFLCAFRRVLVA